MNGEQHDRPSDRPGGDAPGGHEGGARPRRPKILAFYLPQFHPIPENDEWWEPGFTEWTNVVAAKPLFPGHYQPHVPGELGYYDLRVPEVREQQAALAGQYGISGFVYYHYWFHGRRLLERPFDEVLSSGRPDFPFALCWANEEWTRNWDALSGSVLVEQRFSEEDDLAHIRWLVRAFADHRYITIDGRPLMLIYRADLLPDPERTTGLWRSEARAAGFPDLYLAMVESRRKNDDPRPLGFDASVGFRSDAYRRLAAPVDAYREHVVLDYDAAREAALRRPAPAWKRFPGVMVGWDNTARRQSGALIFSGGTPEAYERWLAGAIASVSDVRDEENLIFVAAWNEWAEGNHLEPDRRYGRGYLEATRRALEGSAAPTGEPAVETAQPPAGQGAPAPRLDPDTVAGHAARLVREVITDRRRVVGIGAGGPGIAEALEDAGLTYASISAAADDGEVDALVSRLDAAGDPGALLMVGTLGQWPDPHRLLGALSNWACDHGRPALVVSVPNVAHVDVGLLLLSGRWDPPGNGGPGGPAVRFFTRDILEQLVERCGWKVTAADDYQSIVSSRHPAALRGELPEAMAGALHVLAQSSNPDWAVEHFVWALTPVGVDDPPASYSSAVGGRTDVAVADLPAGATEAINGYFSSLGLWAGEAHLRSEDRIRRTRTQSVRKRIRRALVELALPDRWAVELPLLSDTVDDLAEFYLARSDLVTTYGAGEAFDAVGYVQWAIADQPMVAAAVSRLSEQLRRDTTDSIRAALSASTVDRDQVDAATEALADLFVSRADLRFTVGDGTEVDTAGLLAWAVSIGEADDSAARSLAPYRALIESALSPSATSTASPAAPAAPPPPAASPRRLPGLPGRRRDGS